MKNFFILTFFILLIVIAAGCGSSKPKKYAFECREQSREILQKHIPDVLLNMGYQVTRLDTLQNFFVAEKMINNINTTKGILREFVQLHIAYRTDSLSEITTYFVTENNNKRSIKSLSPELQKKYEPEFLKFVEKMVYYCDPRSKRLF